MKRSSANLKALARESLNGNFGIPIVGYLIIGTITIILTMLTTGFLDTSSTFSLVTNQLLIYSASLLTSLLMAGYDKLILNLNRKTPFALGNIFYVFSHNPDRFLVVNFLMLLVGIVLSLPFDIPSFTDTSATALMLSSAGILVRSLVNLILSCFFGLANYLLLDNPQMGATEALKESCRLMKGSKGRYFYIYLSFLPLSIVCIFTCYIGLLWLTPYIQSTMAYFYMDITGELDIPKPVQEVLIEENSTDTTDNTDYTDYQ